MEFLRKLFGRSEEKSGGVPTELAQTVEAKLALVGHLTTSEPLTREGMVTYISLLERSGIEVPPNRKEEMLDAQSLVMPKPSSDGSMIDGYEQLRIGFLTVHVEELSEVVGILRQLPPHPDTLTLLKKIIDATDVVLDG